LATTAAFATAKRGRAINVGEFKDSTNPMDIGQVTVAVSPRERFAQIKRRNVILHFSFPF
jgi:predicted transcriptional regulator